MKASSPDHPRHHDRRPRGKRRRPPLPTLPRCATVLALDVSSHAAGAAILRSTLRGPVLVWSYLATAPAAWEATRRIDQIADRLADAIPTIALDEVAIEWTTGRSFGGREHRGNAGGSNTLAAAQGSIRQMVRSVLVAPIITVPDTLWTKGVPKPKRAELVAALFAGQYDPRQDKGLDVADAIGLALWRLGQGGTVAGVA